MFHDVAGMFAHVVNMTWRCCKHVCLRPTNVWVWCGHVCACRVDFVRMFGAIMWTFNDLLRMWQQLNGRACLVVS